MQDFLIFIKRKFNETETSESFKKFKSIRMHKVLAFISLVNKAPLLLYKIILLLERSFKKFKVVVIT